MPIELTREQWKKFAPGCPSNYTDALFDNLDLLREAGILDNEYRWCHFAATVFHETGNFKEIRENLNFKTASVLRDTWPSRFRHMSDSELKPFLGNKIALADKVYGCYSGRKHAEIGDVGPGEAYAWRGGGWFNTTFKPAVDGYCRKLGIDTTPPNALDDPVLTLRFAVFEWQETNCNACADENDAKKVAKAINTGSATSNINPVGMIDRQKAFARAWKYWGESGKADTPSSLDDLKQVAKEAATKYGVPAVLGTGGAAHVATKATTETPAKPAVTVQSKIDAAKARVDQAKQAREIVADAKGFIPPALLKNTSAMVGVGAVLAMAAAIILIARKKA